jgi:hypothetical protein
MWGQSCSLMLFFPAPCHHRGRVLQSLPRFCPSELSGRSHTRHFPDTQAGQWLAKDTCMRLGGDSVFWKVQSLRNAERTFVMLWAGAHGDPKGSGGFLQ